MARRKNSEGSSDSARDLRKPDLLKIRAVDQLYDAQEETLVALQQREFALPFRREIEEALERVRKEKADWVRESGSRRGEGRRTAQ